MLISIVIPVYNEEKNLAALFEKLTSVIEGDQNNKYEVIFVDDHSRDNSHETIKRWSEQCERFPVRLIRLARNSGAQIADFVGYTYCRGDAAVYLPADLQCPPEIVPELAAKCSEGFTIVWGLRTGRRDSLFTRLFACIYYFLLKWLVKQDFQFMNVETCLIKRSALDQLLKIKDKNFNIVLLIASLGFRQCSVPVLRRERLSGSSKWTFRKKMKLLLDSIVSFSFIPIRIISYLGILVSFCGFILAGLQIYDKLSGVQKPMGWTSLIVLILILSGIQMLMLGVLGEYLWRAFDQLSSKPYYVIDSLVGFEEKEKDR